MSHEDLNAALQALHRELADSENLDRDDVAHLQATMAEIQMVLEKRANESDTLQGRLSSSARKFEESHPVLTESLGRIADILQQMGI